MAYLKSVIIMLLSYAYSRSWLHNHAIEAGGPGNPHSHIFFLDTIAYWLHSTAFSIRDNLSSMRSWKLTASTSASKYLRSKGNPVTVAYLSDINPF
ncbi:unnamed protein product [Periconia digitata]|uniref:Uncharacterized protein n=1 Tax=Periconia digitata TaxID=1303443 RepID=A0A9W4XQI4_9PLEO|nr:unnamed protein product [Periconia digitata]